MPTADTRILPAGTAYVSDVGMTGGRESVIGFDKEDFMGLFLGKEISGIGVSKGPAELNAVLIELDAESRGVVGIERVHREHA